MLLYAVAMRLCTKFGVMLLCSVVSSEKSENG